MRGLGQNHVATERRLSWPRSGHDCHEVGGTYDRAIGENTEGISIPTGLGPSVDIKSNMPDLYFNYAGRITYLSWGHSYPCGRGDTCYSVNYVC